MNNFRKGGRDDRSGGNRGGFHGGGKRFGGGSDRDRGPVTMHSAVCSSCGKTCEVPFQPTGEKPVYCRDCFAGRNAMGGDRSNRKDPRSFTPNAQPKAIPNTGGGNDDVKRQLEAVNSKLERLISAVQALAQSSVKTPEASAPTSLKTEIKKAVKKVGKKK